MPAPPNGSAWPTPTWRPCTRRSSTSPSRASGRSRRATPESPYDGWPALASIVEAMSGAYEFKRPEGQPPIGSPMGGLGDIVTALFAVIGTLAALRQRDRTGRGPAGRRGHARRHGGRARRRAQLLVDGHADGHPLAGHPARLPGLGRLVHAAGACGPINGRTWPAPSAGRSGPTTPASPRHRAGSTISTPTSGPRSSPGPATKPSARPATP